jgi:hypothetical protein
VACAQVGNVALHIVGQPLVGQHHVGPHGVPTHRWAFDATQHAPHCRGFAPGAIAVGVGC